MYARRFFKGNPSILLDKRLSHRAWEVYCRLELMAGHTRKVISPVDQGEST